MIPDFAQLIALAPEEDHADEPEDIRLDHPEDVLFSVDHWPERSTGRGSWKEYCIADAHPIYTTPGITGAAEYERIYGGFLDYTVEGLIECPGEGFWVLEDMTSVFHKGEWGFTDDDMEFYCGDVRPATPEEILEFWNGGSFWDAI